MPLSLRKTFLEALTVPIRPSATLALTGVSGISVKRVATSASTDRISSFTTCSIPPPTLYSGATLKVIPCRMPVLDGYATSSLKCVNSALGVALCTMALPSTWTFTGLKASLLEGSKSLLISTTTAVESAFRYLMGNAYRTGAITLRARTSRSAGSGDSGNTTGEVSRSSESVRDRVKTSFAEISVPQLVHPEELRRKEDRMTRRPIRESGNSIQYLAPSL